MRADNLPLSGQLSPPQWGVMALRGERMKLMHVLRPMLIMVVLILTSVVQVYSQILPPPPPPPPASSSLHTLTDLDEDGKADVLWRHTQTGDVAAWLSNGVTIKQVAIVSTGVSPVWQIVGAADLNGDGKGDLLWRHTQTGDVAAWLMNGTTIAGSAVIASVGDLDWQIAG